VSRHPASPQHLLKLDARIKRPGGASSGIEFCDVLSDQGDHSLAVVQTPNGKAASDKEARALLETVQSAL